MVNNKIVSLLIFGIVFLGITQRLCSMDVKPAAATFKFIDETMPMGIGTRKTMYCVEGETKKKLGFIAITKGVTLKPLASLPKAIIDQMPAVSGFNAIFKMVKLLAAKEYDLDKTVMLGDLYIFPDLRGKGYAKLLVENACKTVRENKEAEHIVLGPQPFEYVDNKQTTLSSQGPGYQEKVQKLIKLYQRCGFKKLDEASTVMVLDKEEASPTATKS